MVIRGAHVGDNRGQRDADRPARGVDSNIARTVAHRRLLDVLQPECLPPGSEQLPTAARVTRHERLPREAAAWRYRPGDRREVRVGREDRGQFGRRLLLPLGPVRLRHPRRSRGGLVAEPLARKLDLAAHDSGSV